MAQPVQGTGTITFRKAQPADFAAPVTHFFTKHMEEKAKTGFNARDVWQARYVDYKDSKGLAAVWKGLGGAIGKIVLMATGTREDKDIQDLRNETAFYKSVVKAQVAYGKFAGKPVENYEAASAAFEELHRFHQKTSFARDNLQNASKYHQLINTVLNKAVGNDKNVAKSLLEHFATTKLTIDGTFSQNNLLKFYTEYVTIVVGKERDGYGISGLAQNGKLPLANDVKEGTIRMVFAHALKNELDKHEDARYKIFNQTVKELGGCVGEKGSEVNSIIDTLNERLLNVMKEGHVDLTLSPYVDTAKQEEMIGLYSYVEHKSAIEKNLDSARKMHLQIAGTLEGLKSASTPCTYMTLSKIWSEQEAPMEFREYLTLKGEIDDLHKQIAELTKEKEAVRVKAFDTHLEELKELTSQIDEVRNAIAEAQIEEKKSRLQCAQAYANAVAAKKKLGTPIDFTKASIDTIENDINFADIENLNQCQKAYKTALKEQETAEQIVVDATAELNRLQAIREEKRKDTRNGIEEDQAKIGNLIQERQQKIGEINAKTLSLTGVQIVRANDLGVLNSFEELKEIAEKIDAQGTHEFESGLAFKRYGLQKDRFEKSIKNSEALSQLAKQGYDEATQTLKFSDFENFREGLAAAIKVGRGFTASLLNADLRHTVSEKEKAISNVLKEEV